LSLGIYEGETSGCTIIMPLSGSVETADQMMRHIGCLGKTVQSNIALVASGMVALHSAKSAVKAKYIEFEFKGKAHFVGLRKVFN